MLAPVLGQYILSTTVVGSSSVAILSSPGTKRLRETTIHFSARVAMCELLPG